MVIHVHNLLANNKWPKKLEAFWVWLVEKIKEHDVRVLMGDFNMSLFRVIPELRSRGTTVDLGAWYPWKEPAGAPMSDSCGIFFVNCPGDYQLHKGLGDLHADSETGILHLSQSAVAGEDVEGGFDRIDPDGGPGMSLTTYLPKWEKDLRRKFEPSLTPSEASQLAVQEMNAKGKGKAQALEFQQRQRTCIKVREKRLQAKLWRCNGQDFKGSHFPICAFTQNVCRRSPEKTKERSQKHLQHARERRGQPQWRRDTGQVEDEVGGNADNAGDGKSRGKDQGEERHNAWGSGRGSGWVHERTWGSWEGTDGKATWESQSWRPRGWAGWSSLGDKGPRDASDARGSWERR